MRSKTSRARVSSQTMEGVARAKLLAPASFNLASEKQFQDPWLADVPEKSL